MIPIDNLRPGSRPHPLASHNMSQRIVQNTYPEGLPDKPGVQVQYHKPATARAVPVHGIEALL
ncbi:MAG TPA: hypothetical protein VE844_04265, partial [Gammaproteobacteria bacterium]|nr:hypothetical protein [Gammaproteobacteria bacterium]